MSEHAHQVALIDWWRLQHKRYGLPEFALLAIPNGGARNVVVAGKLKTEGVRKGVLDLLMPVPRGAFAGLWIEMKYGSNKLTEEQLEFRTFVEGQGYKAVACWSWEAAKNEIGGYLELGFSCS
jgi:hypothetical protein